MDAVPRANPVALRPSNGTRMRWAIGAGVLGFAFMTAFLALPGSGLTIYGAILFGSAFGAVAGTYGWFKSGSIHRAWEGFAPDTIEIGTAGIIAHFPQGSQITRARDPKVEVPFDRFRNLKKGRDQIWALHWTASDRAKELGKEFQQKHPDIRPQGRRSPEVRAKLEELQAQLPVGEWSGLCALTNDNALEVREAWDAWKSSSPPLRAGSTEGSSSPAAVPAAADGSP